MHRTVATLPYYSDDSVTLYLGDCRELLPAMAATGMRFDCAVTDPPYGETSLAWDRWPGGWPALVAALTSSMWCFGSLRMFLDRHDEFDEWSISHDDHLGQTQRLPAFVRTGSVAFTRRLCIGIRGRWGSVLHEDPQRDPYTGAATSARSKFGNRAPRFRIRRPIAARLALR
jgi:site-specific DNA-methyltransferase (adenine-specific)